MKKFFLYNLGTFAQFTCDFRRTGFSGKKEVRHLGSSFIRMMEVSQRAISHLSDVPLTNEIGRNGTWRAIKSTKNAQLLSYQRSFTLGENTVITS